MKPFKHITFADRQKIEELYSSGMMPTQIAEKLGVHFATIYNELRRGDTGDMDANGRIGYSADLAQRRVYQQRRFSRAGATENGGAQ